MTDMTFSHLGLAPQLLRALEEEKYHTPTPIQHKAIPLMLEGEDVIGIAQTGTGKTAAFTLPLLDNLASDGGKASPRGVRALILAPTRELVTQISDSIRTYGRHMRLRQAVVMGGVGHRGQIDRLRGGVDILVAAPGRLLDLVEGRHIDLSACDYLVLDEADRMLDMGFIRDVRKIIAKLPRDRQTVMFSATMPAEIEKLAADILQAPKHVEIATKSVAVERIDQRVHHLSRDDKRARLASLLGGDDVSRAIVFTRTKRGADKVAKQLGIDGIAAEAMHGNKSQNARQRALDGFRRGRTRVLVATDIASRGIDVDDVSHVVNFEMPAEAESYVHRIGRTARAGAEGIAISLCDASERGALRDIEKLIGRTLTVVGDGPKGEEPATAKKKRRSGRKGNGNGNGGAGAAFAGAARGKPRARRQRRPERRAA